MRTGRFLDDPLARHEALGAARTVDWRQRRAGQALKPDLHKASVYADGTRLAGLSATGPWAFPFLSEHALASQAKSLRRVKGSHIVVGKLLDHDHACIFQNPDKRIIFVIPCEGEFSLIGTTYVEHLDAIGAVHIDAAGVPCLRDQAGRQLAHPMRPEQATWSCSGLRPLLDGETGAPPAVTRDQALDVDGGLLGAAEKPAVQGWCAAHWRPDPICRDDGTRAAQEPACN